LTRTRVRADSRQITDIALEGISAGYGRSTVLRDISISLAPGETVGIVGPNGAGKSTLLATMAGLIRPTAGSILAAGRAITAMSPEERRREGLALVAEGRRVFPSLSVTESIALACRALHLPRSATPIAIAAAFQRFPSLAARRDVTGALLSGGEQQMLCLAMALVGEPSVLLIDEPFMGLAPTVTQGLSDEFRTLASSGVALVIADESRATLERLGLERVVSLHDMR
jgi:branched-chain amino acid transport system ATP-binding protein